MSALRFLHLATLLSLAPSVQAQMQARPAEMAPRAASALLLDVTRAGNGWLSVGDHGVILRAEEAQHWTQQPSPVDVMLNRVRVSDARNAWIVGHDGSLLHSADAGLKWTLREYDPSWGRPYFDVLFTDAQNGWLAGANGRLKRTRDGGVQWQDAEFESHGEVLNLYQLLALSDGTLMMVGERGLIARCVDGEHWQRLRSPYAGALFGAARVGEHGAVIYGQRGHAFHADDARKLPVLSAAEAQAQQDAALDPNQARAQRDPVMAVPGWQRLANDDHESLFGAASRPDGGVLLLGTNGRVFDVRLPGTLPGKLLPIALPDVANLNAGVIDGSQLIAVGSAGLQRFKLPH